MKANSAVAAVPAAAAVAAVEVPEMACELWSCGKIFKFSSRKAGNDDDDWRGSIPLLLLHSPPAWIPLHQHLRDPELPSLPFPPHVLW